MQAAGCEAWHEAEELAVMGLIEPLKELPRLLRLRRELIQRWTDNPPDVFVGIDAPDFNLGLEKKLRAAGVATVHYVSPSVWAWRQGRVRKVAAAVDKVLCLLPFEKKFYEAHNVAAEFVGHPMADSIVATEDRNEVRRKLGITASPLVAILPGSRHSEVSRLGPLFAETAAWLKANCPGVAFVAPMAGSKLRDEFAVHLANAGIAADVTLLDGQSRDAMAAADVVLLASVTAALEAALLGRPMVAAYRLAALTYVLLRAFRMVKVSHFTLPNLLSDEPLVPEFMQAAATPEAMGRELLDMLQDPDRRAAIERKFVKLREELAQGADKLAADAVLELIDKK